MCEVAKRISELATAQRKAACLRLCEQALDVWEKSFPKSRVVNYRGTMTETFSGSA